MTNHQIEGLEKMFKEIPPGIPVPSPIPGAKKIWFDMDGVLTDLHNYVKHFLPDIVEGNNENPGFDAFMEETVERFNLFEVIKPRSDFEFGYQLICELCDQGFDVRILSSCTRRKKKELIAKQKQVWLNMHGLGALPATFTEGSKEKAVHASGILIDDWKGSGEPWVAAGGTWIHHKNFLDTARQLDLLLGT